MVIMTTAYGSVESAVEAMRKGAYDYITKPFINDDIKLTVRNALNQRELFRENRSLKRALKEKYRFERIIGTSEAMQQVYDLMEKVCRTTTNILITGQSGTGKELVAQGVHYNSDRAEKPFLAVNCGALAESLLESELFGHVKGAFTGATSSKVGYFQRADGGTLLLDEIGEVSPALQVRLLRAIQEREVVPVGSTDSIKLDVRLICATNRDLEAEVAAGRFREDLYYRINVMQIVVPALRDRRDDIPLLIRHFLKPYAEKAGRPNITVSREAMKCLINYDWAGNVRELENVVERAVLLVEGEVIVPEHLPEKVRDVSIGIEDPEGKEMTLAELEKGHILKVMDQVGENKAEAARILGINLATLYRKLDRYKAAGVEGEAGVIR
jgi:DNA-binding NtrC family response regulator